MKSLGYKPRTIINTEFPQITIKRFSNANEVYRF